jgi:hypothetical protein
LGQTLEVSLVVGEEPSNEVTDDHHVVEESAEAFESLAEGSKSAGDIGTLATSRIFDAFPGAVEVTE